VQGPGFTLLNAAAAFSGAIVSSPVSSTWYRCRDQNTWHRCRVKNTWYRCRVENLGLRGLGFRVKVFGVQGSGFRVWEHLVQILRGLRRNVLERPSLRGSRGVEPVGALGHGRRDGLFDHYGNRVPRGERAARRARLLLYLFGVEGFRFRVSIFGFPVSVFPFEI